MTRYLVTVVYQEPTRARWRGEPPRDYRASFSVDAISRAEAAAVARRRFDATLVESGVGWVREVVETSVQELGIA